MTAQDARISTKLGLFLDPCTDQALFSKTALVMPIWIAGTAANLTLAKVVRETLDTYVTTFDVSSPGVPLELAVGFREMLGLHHGKMEQIHVFGLPVGGERDSRWSEEGFELAYCKDGVAIFHCNEYVFG